MPAVASILDRMLLELRQASNTTTAPPSNSTDLTVDERLQCLPLPYGFIGIALQLIIYYICFCVLVLRQSPCILVFRCRGQQLKHHDINIGLCGLTVLATVVFTAVTYFSVCAQNTLGIFVAVNFILVAVCANVTIAHANRLISPLSASQESSYHAKSGLCILGLFIFEVLGLISAANFIRAGWDKPLMKAACIVPVVMLGVGALVLAGNLAWSRHQSMQTMKTVDRVVIWISGVIFMGMTLIPLFMDAALAVGAENLLGTPLGKDGKAIGIYVGYVIVCLLPFFCT